MKLFVLLPQLAVTAQSHGRFSKLIVNGMAEDKERGFIRETKNYQDDHGASDVSSGRAGGIDHPGPIQIYMAKTPEGKSIDSWDGSSQVWFKFVFLGDNLTPKGVKWPTYSPTIAKNSSFKVPESTPNGDYLVRLESITVHQATATGGAQGGTGTPGPLVSIPGVYKSGGPGFILTQSTTPTSHSPPGPEARVG
ncbi:glycoside hydrolase family 61 protein-like protein [Hyaloscypha sp. PMI_1271]|nr:glycoside hydrolase family 61 protein-like protein [Hyaloscypha sp. PMI_1271]